MKSTITKTMCIGAFAAMGLFAAGAASAQMHQGPTPQTGYPTTGATETTPGSLNNINLMNDTDFAKEAAEGGMAEVKLGQLAQDKGSSDAVKDFGKRMVTDHTQASDQLRSIAKEKSIDIPAELNKHDQKTYDQLSKLSGDEFDRAYAKDMVKDHRDDIDLFQREAGGGQDGTLKSFASSTLPTLQDHLKMAKDMLKTVSGKGGN
jgi:putative membrane protein